MLSIGITINKICFRQTKSVCNLVQLEITKLIGRWQKTFKMCKNSTEGRFTVDRSGKCFNFANNLFAFHFQL